MKYLLDTNACIQYLHGKNPHVRTNIAAHPPADIVVCSVVVAELLHGAEKSQNPAAELLKVRAFLASYRSLSFDDNWAEHYGRIRADLERRGLVIGGFDMLIAATTLAHGLTLVTHNTGEFSRVAGLLLVDWEAS